MSTRRNSSAKHGTFPRPAARNRSTVKIVESSVFYDVSVPIELEEANDRRQRAHTIKNNGFGKMGITNKGFSFDEFQANIKTTWLTKHIKTKECSCFIASEQDPDKCGCGEYKIAHKYADEKPGTWDKKLHTRERSCEFGVVDFMLENDGMPSFDEEHKATYIRVADDTPVETIDELFDNIWKLKRPNLLISVIGGHTNAYLNTDAVKLLDRGLSQVLQAADVWLFTDASATGIASVIGKAFQEGCVNNSTQDSACFGIIPWGCVRGKSIFSGHKGKEVIYKVPNVHQPVLDNRVYLDHNHTHFLFVDDGTVGQFGCDMIFRAKMEKFFCNSETGEVPSVILLVEGGMSAIDSVFTALSTNPKVAIIIFDGSGRAADVITRAKREYESAWRSRMRLKSEQFLNFILNQLETFFDRPKNDLYHAAQKVESCIKNHSSRLVILKKKDDVYSFNMALLQACSATVPASGKGQKVLDTLKLAMVFNQAGIAEEHLNVCNDPSTLNETFYNALVIGKSEFVDLLLSNGVDVPIFLADSRWIRKLYKKQMSDSSSFMATLARFYPLMKDIVKNKDFCPQFIDEILNILLKEDYTKCYGDAGTMKNHYGQVHNRYQELIIWSVLGNHREFAYSFWKLDEENSLPNCMIIARLFRAMRKLDCFDESQLNELQKNQKYFEDLSITVLSQYYKNDPYRTLDLIRQEVPLWGHKSLIVLAANMRFRAFIAHPSCQRYLEALWWNKIKNNRKTEDDRQSFTQRLEQTFRDHHRTTLLSKKINTAKEPIIPDGFDESDYQRKAHGRCLNAVFSVWWYLKFFFVVPIGKLIVHVLMYIIFLCLFAHQLLFPETSFKEEIKWTVFICVTSLTLDEIRQLIEVNKESKRMKIREWGNDIWNILDALSMAVYYIGFIVFHADHMHFGRGLLALGFVIWLMKIMQFYRVSSHLGPYVVMIYHMVKHLFAFILVLFLAVIAFGVFMHTLLYRGTVESWSVLFRLIFRPYLFLFGEISVGSELTNSTTVFATQKLDNGTEISVVLAMAIYLLFSNVLLLNLLIAVFNNIYEDVQMNTTEIWRFERYDMIMEFKQKPLLPFPFSVPENIWRISRACCCSRRVEKKETKTKRDNIYDQYMDFQKQSMRKYWKERKEEESESISERLKSLVNTVQNIQSSGLNFILSISKQFAAVIKESQEAKKSAMEAKQMKSRRQSLNLQKKFRSSFIRSTVRLRTKTQ